MVPRDYVDVVISSLFEGDMGHVCVLRYEGKFHRSVLIVAGIFELLGLHSL